MNKTSLGGALLAIGVLCFSGGAKAAPRTHDGFQFRGTIGGGYLSDSRTVTGLLNLTGKMTGSGPAGVLELYFGGTPAEGLIIGGFLSGMAAVGPKETIEGGVSVTADSSVSLNLSSVGPYIDYYPDATSGFHVLGALSYSQVAFVDNNGVTNDSDTSSGFGIGGGLGYDWWVGDEWSLGVLGRFTYAATSHSISGVKFTDDAVAPAILFSACFQ